MEVSIPTAQPQQTSDAKPPGKRKLLFLLVSLIVIVVAGAIILAMRSSKTDKSLKQVPPATYSVEITNTGFVPQTLSIPTGSTVTWVNKTNNPYRIAANPQPSHSSFPELDSKDPIGPDGKYSFKFTASGTIVYNNHYKPTTNNGEIKVTDASN